MRYFRLANRKILADVSGQLLGLILRVQESVLEL
jgi:hypothetical protein